MLRKKIGKFGIVDGNSSSEDDEEDDEEDEEKCLFLIVECIFEMMFWVLCLLMLYFIFDVLV